MLNNDEVILTIEELSEFLRQIESGVLGLNNAAGVALARNNSDGRPFVAVLDEKQQLVMGRWVTEEIFENGKDIVRYGAQKAQ